MHYNTRRRRSDRTHRTASHQLVQLCVSESGAGQEGWAEQEGTVDVLVCGELGRAHHGAGGHQRGRTGWRLLGAQGVAADTRGSHPDDSLVRPPDVDPPRMARAVMGLR